jgi:hypothetical protein
MVLDRADNMENAMDSRTNPPLSPTLRLRRGTSLHRMSALVDQLAVAKSFRRAWLGLR